MSIDISKLIKAIETERDKVVKVFSPHAPYDWCIQAIKSFAAKGDDQPVDCDVIRSCPKCGCAAGWEQGTKCEAWIVCIYCKETSKVFSLSANLSENLDQAIASWNSRVPERESGAVEALNTRSDAKGPVDYKFIMELITAVHGMIGYCESLKPGSVVTAGWSERLKDYYVPKLEESIAAYRRDSI